MSLIPAATWVSVWIGEEQILKKLRVARDWKTRALGLMFRKDIPAFMGQGLLFPRCRSLHTFHMRFDLDVMFLDEDGICLKACRGVRPWRMVSGPRGSRHCLEVTAGLLPDTLPEGPLRFEAFREEMN